VITLVALMAGLTTAASALGVGSTSGSERFDGGLVVSNPTGGHRRVAGSVVAMSGVFTGLGRIVERPNRAGDAANVNRDDLVFSTGTIHLVNEVGPTAFAVNPRTCTATFTAQGTSRVDGGSGRFAGATGTFTTSLHGSGATRRNTDGSCDRQHPPLVEVDSLSGTGTLTF
jgi:hypothetical protein